MDDEHIPHSTRRDVAALLVLAVEQGARVVLRVARRMRRHTDPPSDIEVRSILGHEYTGLLLIEGNRVLGGFVIRSGGSGPEAVSPRPSPAPPPIILPREQEERSPFLRGWAESGHREDEPW